MQIDVVLVRTNELYRTERITRPRALPQSKRAGGDLLQIGVGDRIDSGADISPAHNLQSLPSRVAGIAAAR